MAKWAANLINSEMQTCNKLTLADLTRHRALGEFRYQRDLNSKLSQLQSHFSMPRIIARTLGRKKKTIDDEFSGICIYSSYF